jgi:O-antigen ligase
MFIVIILLLTSAFLGPYFFFIGAKFHAIRVLPSLVVAMYSRSTSIRVSQPLRAIFLFFTVYFFYTLIISLFHYKSIFINDLINFVVLYLFIVSLVLLVAQQPNKFFKALKIFLIFFVVVAFVMALYEEITLNHLSNSAMLMEPKKWPQRHFPTGFYTNPNDFAAITIMASMFLLALPNKKKSFSTKASKAALVLISLWICYATESKLNLMIFCIFLTIFYRLWTIRSLFVLVVSVVLVGSYLSQKIDLGQAALEVFNFSLEKGGSTLERLNIYYYSLYSIVESYGLGLGIGASQFYFDQFVGYGLTGITTDPHSYLFELLINSGILVLVLYLFLNLFLVLNFIKGHGNRLMLLQLILYNLILFSSSSSIFLWPHYVFLISYAAYKDEFLS